MPFKRSWFVLLVVLFLSPVTTQHPAAAQELTPCPSETGPNGIVAGEYLPQQLTREESQWLWQAFGHRGTVSAHYAGEACLSSAEVSVETSSGVSAETSAEVSPGQQQRQDNIQTVCALDAVGPAGLRPGLYVASRLTQHERNWLCRMFGDCRAKELAPTDYGGQRCPGDPQRPLHPDEGRVNSSSSSGEISSSESSGPVSSGPSSSGRPTSGQPSSGPSSSGLSPSDQPSSGPPSSGPSSSGRVSSSDQSRVDFDGYCLAGGFAGVEQVGPYARDWYCQDRQGDYYEIDVQDVCMWQYGVAYEYTGLEDADDPFGWTCSIQPQPTIAEGPQTFIEAAPIPADRVSITVTSSEDSSSSAPGVCRMPEALAVGDRARVMLQPPLPNRLRQKPGMSAKQIGLIQPGEEFYVIGGPRCVGGYRWWKVRTQWGQKGWTAEGDADGYWLERAVVIHGE
jgi:hypothetical protein